MAILRLRLIRKQVIGRIADTKLGIASRPRAKDVGQNRVATNVPTLGLRLRRMRSRTRYPISARFQDDLYFYAATLTGLLTFWRLVVSLSLDHPGLVDLARSCR